MHETPDDPGAASAQELGDLLAQQGLHSVFQPIVDLDTGSVVAYEALVRGPADSPLHTPDALFAAARTHGVLAALDAACRTAAFRGAIDHELLTPLTVFVNVEPEVLDSAPLETLLAIAATAPTRLRVVVEITERALAHRPAELLRTVERVREVGWGVALDDVGAEAMSLAFMPLLAPDVIKLDLRLVQDRPGPEVAQVMNAVNAHAESSGALILAEGIEDERHLRLARALGAQLGQGWMFGRPRTGAAPGLTVGRLRLPAPPAATGGAPRSPFALLPPGTALRRAPKALLIELSKQLEREAMRLGRTCVVASTFQEARHFTPSTTGRYRDLVERTGFVCALGEGLPPEPLPGVRGAHLSPDDPARGEWDVVVLGTHFNAALLARDLGDQGPEALRTFEYALTYERSTVAAAARSLLSRVAPRPPAWAHHDLGAAAAAAAAGTVGASGDAAGAAAPVPLVRTGGGSGASAGEQLLDRALAATNSGITIADMSRPDQPLIYVNPAFERLSGTRAEDVLGRNCRFLQGPETDGGDLDALRAALRAGQEWRGVLLNHRGPELEPWWNEIHLAPVHDAQGRLVQYIGVQSDVSDRVAAERALAVEQERSRSYLRRLEQQAWTDPLTGLDNRRRFTDQLETALWEARAAESAVAVALLDLDGFKAVNDDHGHAVGDELLVTVAHRLRERLRRSDVVARLGGDEFLVALPGLQRASARQEAERVLGSLRRALTEPVTVAGHELRVAASAGLAVFPDDGQDVGELVHAADAAMYRMKAERGALAER